MGTENSTFGAGLSYNDTSGDMEVSFLDAVAFQAAVDEPSQTLEVILQMRDIPPTALLRQTTNVIEYSWTVFVYLDPSKSSPADTPGDYYFAVNTTVLDPSLSVSGSGLTPIPGDPVTVPINQILENKAVYNSAGGNVSSLNAVADPDSDTLTLKGRVPGIKSNAVFSFATGYYDGTTDRPDNYVSPPVEATPSQQVASTLPKNDVAQLLPVGTVRAFPGPEHYAGDVLTFEIQTDGSFDETVAVSMTLDNKGTTEVSATMSFFDLSLVLPLALDTSNLSGQHVLKFTTADGKLNETYSFDVLPADQRPVNENDASWVVEEIDCCMLHYISGTAAGRDIDFLAQHFQNAAEDFATITGKKIDPKLDVYFIDRILGNGGFGGSGKLVVSYTDRYYGPTMGVEGLQTLARHEFTHAANIGLADAGEGVEFNYEGLAVYVAGGHYKPEPLAERGAALYDLGYYVPVGQFLQQHELAYLYPAAMLTFVVEKYGSDAMWKFLAFDDHPGDNKPASLEVALPSMFGISQSDFDRDFQAWLESKEPGQQLDDLRLTIELQDLRRQYQDIYAPSPYFLLAQAVEEVARLEYLPVVMREPQELPNVAIELIIANAQQAILEKDYARAAELNRVIGEIISSGKFLDPLAKNYLDLVLAAASKGYQVTYVNIQGDVAIAYATAAPPALTSLELQKIDGVWQLKP
jgi:hypothetical protein